MSETTDIPAGPAELRMCCICDIRVIGGTAVSLIEKGSTPARTLYACGPCVRRHNLLPLDDQENPTGDGQLQFRGR